MMRPMNPAHPADAALLDYKRALRQGLEAHDIDQADLAEACLVDPSMVSRWCSRKTRDALGAEHLALLATRFPELALDLLAWMAERAGATVAPKRGAAIGDRASILTLLRDMHRETSELAQALMAGLTRDADHQQDLTNGELDVLDRELLDVERVTQELRRLVDAEKAERGKVYDLARKRGGGA